MKCLSLSGKLHESVELGEELMVREEMYRGGGLFSVTSKILVNDFLSMLDLLQC